MSTYYATNLSILNTFIKDYTNATDFTFSKQSHLKTGPQTFSPLAICLFILNYILIIDIWYKQALVVCHC